jgi:hypothetical protein
VAIFYGAFFCCLWRWVDVGLIYHCGGLIRGFPIFYWGGDFFRGCLSYPNGLSDYLAALLAQSLFYSWWGAFCLTLQAAVIDGCVRTWLTVLGAPSLRWIGFGPPLLLLAVYSGYSHYSEAITALALVAIVARVCLAWPSPRAGVRATLLAALALGLYVAASRAFLVFVVFWVILEFRNRTPWTLKVLPAAVGVLVPLALGRFVYGLGPIEIGETLLPVIRAANPATSRGTLLLLGLYFFIPLAGLFALLIARRDPNSGETPMLAGKVPAPLRTGRNQSAMPRSPSFGWGSWVLQSLVVLAAVAGVVAVTHDRRLHAELLVDYCCWNRAWPQALAAARQTSSNPHVACAGAEAAYHAGTLVEELPSVPKPEDLLLFDERLTGDWRKSDLYFDLGYVNMALHFLTESMELWGERPILLERLATVNLALGNTDTARVFLNVLARCPFHSYQARNALARLEADPALAQDEEVQRLRACMPRRDSVLRLPTKETMLLLLQANRQNRMAFEYLMSYYLLSKDLQGFAQRLPLAKAFAQFRLSPLWDEALALAAKRSARPLDPRAGTASREAEMRLEALRQAMDAFRGNTELARTALRAEYAKTYYYYYFLQP